MPGPMPTFPFRALLAVEVVRDVEADAALNDGAAMQAAAAATDDRAGRIVERARRLEPALGLDTEFAALAATAARLGLGLAVASTLLAALVAGALLGHERRINVLGAVTLLVLPNVVGLLLWAWAALHHGTGGEGLFGRAAAALAARFVRREPAARTLAAAARLLDRHGLTAWVVGGLNHALWTVAYALAAAVLVIAFAFGEYRLGWETTILDPATLQLVVQGIGRLPAALGLPGDEAALAALDAAQRSRALAWWLIAAVLGYGALPRLGLALLCLAVWRRRSTRLALDLASPDLRALLNRFDTLVAPQVLDEERAAAAHDRAAPAAAVPRPGFALLSYELPPELEPPAALVQHASWHERLDGALAERRAAAERLATQPPQRLLVVCHAPSTPDRGTGRFLEPLQAVPTALLLAPAERAAASAARWRAWLDALGRGDVALFGDAEEALRWSVAGR